MHVTRRARLLVAGALLALVLLALLLALSDAAELKRRAGEVRWAWVAAASLAALLSYAGIAECQRTILRLLGHEVPALPMVRTVLVSTTVNRSLRSGGASGFATLAWLLADRGVTAAAALAATAGHSLLSNVVFLLLFAWGACDAWAAPWHAGDRPQAAFVAFSAAAGAFLLLLAGTGAVLAWPPARVRWTGLAARACARLASRVRRPELGDRATAFFARTDEALRQLSLAWRTRRFALAFALAALRIGLSVTALLSCLRAADVRVPLLVVVLAYTAGKVAGVLSFVPAGLGLVEGSLSGVLTAFGVPYEAALLVALLNRFAYHLVPASAALVSLAAARSGERG